MRVPVFPLREESETAVPDVSSSVQWATGSEIVRGLFTAMVTAAEMAVLPAASRAMALSVWPPLDTDSPPQRTAEGADTSSTPILRPSSWNCTPTTPTLSTANADTATVSETEEPSAGWFRDTVGGGKR